MNFEICPVETSDETKREIKKINKRAVYTHIGWYGSAIHNLQVKDLQVMIENVTDNFIIMPHMFLISKAYLPLREKLFENTNVYHIMMIVKNCEYTITDQVIIFCKKGKTTTTKLSFEKNNKININISNNKTYTIDMNKYIGLCDDNIISIEEIHQKRYREDDLIMA